MLLEWVVNDDGIIGALHLVRVPPQQVSRQAKATQRKLSGVETSYGNLSSHVQASPPVLAPIPRRRVQQK